jgi:hypothetical protein
MNGRQSRLKPGLCLMTAGLIGLFCCGGVAGQDSGTSTNQADATGSKTNATSALYTQIGTDPTFRQLLDDKVLPMGRNSTEGVRGSIIHVNKAVVEQGLNGSKAIPQDIKIHTLCNSAIPRTDFPKWTRWYQEDGYTQVFRLFQGETNVRNDRPLSARVEAFSNLKWHRGEWHEWEGTYTIVKPHDCAIFQAKNDVNAWGVMIGLSDTGDIKLIHRRHQEAKIIARNMTGKSFTLKVRDNGYDYEVYLNGEKVGTGYYDRPEGHTSFRWGMYKGEHEQKRDAMIFVSGVTFK